MQLWIADCGLRIGSGTDISVYSTQYRQKCRSLSKSAIRNPQSAIGFTLIELMIAIFIALIIFTVGFASISTTMAARKDSEARVGATEDARMLFQMLERDIAGAVPMTIGVQNQTFDVTTWQTILGNSTNPSPVKIKLMNTYFDSLQNKTVGGTALPQFVPSTDVLQFFTRIDSRYSNTTGDTIDPIFFVRYYVNNYAHLCRQVVEFKIPPNQIQISPPGQTLPGEIPSLSNTPATADFDDDSQALFEYAGAIHFAPMQWSTDSKGLTPLTPPSPATAATWQQATHIQVTLYMYDPSKTPIYPPTRSFIRNIELPFSFAGRPAGTQ